ncbi:MAG TPA: lamin tail domain-containing protein, partial [Flavisolibacter sp.]|nr:lamin tail domain-containing protein [Flavisolibacter sp.]
MKTLLFIVLAFTFLTSNAQVQKYDVVIDEIMADPSPAIQLPEAEYIEIRNISGHTINLQSWQLSSLTTVSKPFA